jgi:hypothetical protein
MAGVTEEIATRDPAELVRQRDEVLVRLLKLKASSESLP